MLTKAKRTPNLTLLASHGTACMHVSADLLPGNGVFVILQGKDHCDDMEAEEVCQEATGDAGVQTDRHLFSIVKANLTKTGRGLFAC